MNILLINQITLARIFCRALSLLYVVAAAWNDGFSNIILGIPFGFYVLYDAYMIRDNNKKLSVFLVMFVTMVTLSSQYHRSGWHWFYPALGTTVTLQKDTPFFLNPYHPFTLMFMKPINALQMTTSITTLPIGSEFTLTRQHITGHPDFGTTYVFAITLKDKQMNDLLVSEAQKRPINFTAIGDAYTYLRRDTLYVNSYDLGVIHATSSLDVMPRFHLLTAILMLPLYLCALLALNIARKIAWSAHLTDNNTRKAA